MENSLIGYVQDRANLSMDKEDQRELLIKHGVEPGRIYELEEGLAAAVASCREGSTLVIWAASVIGAQVTYDETVIELGELGSEILVLRKKLNINCEAGATVIAGQKDIRAANASMGERVGRKLSLDEHDAKLIKKYVRDGETQANAAIEFDTSTRAVSQIMNGTYFKNQKKGKKK